MLRDTNGCHHTPNQPGGLKKWASAATWRTPLPRSSFQKPRRRRTKKMSRATLCGAASACDMLQTRADLAFSSWERFRQTIPSLLGERRDRRDSHGYSVRPLYWLPVRSRCRMAVATYPWIKNAWKILLSHMHLHTRESSTWWNSRQKTLPGLS